MLDDQTFTERQQVTKQPGTCMNCHASRLRAVQEARRRRHRQGLRADEPDAVLRGAQAGERTRSPASTATTRRRCSCGSRGRRSWRACARSRRAQGVAGLRREHAWPRARRCARSCAASATSSTTSRAPEKRLTYPWAKGLKVDEILAVLRGEPARRLDPRRERRAGAQGAASRVRDVEPGHPRAVGRRLRRLPHAVHARRRAEDQRPPRAQPGAEHQQRLPDLPQVAGGGAARARRDHPGARVRAAQPRDGGGGRADRRPQGGARAAARRTPSSICRASCSAARSSCSTSSRRRTPPASMRRRRRSASWPNPSTTPARGSWRCGARRCRAADGAGGAGRAPRNRPRVSETRRRAELQLRLPGGS